MIIYRSGLDFLLNGNSLLVFSRFECRAVLVAWCGLLSELLLCTAVVCTHTHTLPPGDLSRLRFVCVGVLCTFVLN